MVKKITKKSASASPKKPWPECSTAGCKIDSVMQWTDHKTKKTVHGCAKHRAEYERTSPEFKAALARFNKEQAERAKKRAAGPAKKKIVRKTTKKAVKK